MQPTGDRLLEVIKSVRLRWRMRLVLRGVALVLGTGFLVFLGSAYGMDFFKFTPTSVTVFRILTYLLLALLSVRFLILPVTKRVSDKQVALYIEEHEPDLEGTLLAAVEVRENGQGVSVALSDRLLRNAIDRCEAVESGKRIERTGLYQSSGMLVGVMAMAAGFVVFNPLFLSNGAPYLLGLGRDAGESPYSVAVEPGSITVARGADQRIVARLAGFVSDEVEIATRRGDDLEWERTLMIPAEDGDGFMILLFDLADSTDYYVQANNVRSGVFRIDVVDVPYVDRMQLNLDFPRYTGLPDELIEDGGDVAALRGTRVTVRIRPTVEVPAGRIVLDAGDTVALEVGEDGRLTGSFPVVGEGFYHVELQRFDGEFMISSRDYTIFPLEDQPPLISFETPGRDVKVTSIEEVFTGLEAHDDYGLRSVELVFAVNGGDEQTVPLHSGARRKNVTASHTFFLEEIDLQPGDFVSYFARAEDNNSIGGRQTVSTDIYFMTVRPFDQQFSQSQQAPPGAGQGAGVDAALSETQRQIIAATFNLRRDRDRYEPDDFRENVSTVGLSQGRLREQVQTLVERMNARGIGGADSNLARITELLPQAASAMTEAEDRLVAGELSEAISAEQTALQQLQRAESLYRDVQVGQQQGGGGGAGGAAAEDLADLFDLELDRARNQYESVQRGQQQQSDQQVDEALERLRELARRQQQEIERRRRAQSANNQTGGGGAAQRELADQVEEAARQLERLSREQSQPELMETVQQMREAADAMRRAAARNDDRGVGESVSALERLQDARRQLDRSREERMGRDMQDVQERVGRLQEQQDRIRSDVEDLVAEGGGTAQERSEIGERKRNMVSELQDIETQLTEMSRNSRGDNPEAADALEGAAEQIRDSKLKEMVQLTGAVVERQPSRAGIYEDEIASRLGELEQAVDEAADVLGNGAGADVEDALERTRELARDIRALGERAEDRARQGSQQGGQDGQQPGQNGQGDQTAQGQAGQPGQQGGNVGPGNGVPRNGGAAGDGRLSPSDIRQFRREARERRLEAEELRRLLAAEGVDTSPLGEIIGDIRRLEGSNAFSDLEGVRQLEAEIVQGLMEFEFSLRRELQRQDPERLVLSGSDEVPDEYRDLVSEYYRSLSEGNR